MPFQLINDPAQPLITDLMEERFRTAKELAAAMLEEMGAANALRALPYCVDYSVIIESAEEEVRAALIELGVDLNQPPAPPTEPAPRPSVLLKDSEELVKALKGDYTDTNFRLLSGFEYQLPKDLYINPGQFDGRSITVEAEAKQAAIVRCPGVLYFSGLQNTDFFGINFQGAINSQHMKDCRFYSCRFDDPNGIGWAQRVLFKTTGAPVPYKNPKAVGAGPLIFDSCEFNQHPDSNDMALDFVATQGVTITHSIFERCVRGVMQAKGGSGLLTPFTFAHNWVQDAGKRGVQVGGGTNPEFFNPPYAEAGAEFGSADIHDNIIEGGGCAFTASTCAGPVDFYRNLCIGQSGQQFRLLDENQWVPGNDGVRYVSIYDCIMLDWKPPQWPNTNVLASGGMVLWPTIRLWNLLFNYPSRQEFWGFPMHEQNPLGVKRNIREVKDDLIITRAANGQPRVSSRSGEDFSAYLPEGAWEGK